MRAPLAAILLTLSAAALAAPPQRPGQWSIELTTSGGFDGRGSGGLTITSGGELTVAKRERKSCTFTITGNEKRAIGQLVRAADPGKWVASYALASNPEGCCDQIRTTLKLTEGGTYVTYWFNRAGPMPPDLTAIARRLFAADDPASLRSRYFPQCTP
jgi:hypothetical protein